MRNKLFYLFFLVLLGCNAIDIDFNEDFQLKKGDFTFYDANTTNIEKTNLVNKVKLTTQIDSTYLCLKEAGFFYCSDKDLLFDKDMTLELLSESAEITKIIVPQEILNNQIQFTHEYEFPISQVGGTYFFRSYAFFKDDCLTPTHERTYLEENSNPESVTLTEGWYPVPFDGYLWERKGGISVQRDNKIIIGSGCSDIAFCLNNVKSIPFLELTNVNGRDSLTQVGTPIDKFQGDLFNRINAVAFNIGDSTYIGTGEINNTPKSNFYVYHPDNQDSIAREITPPIEFKPRTRAIGFAINNIAYIGLGENGGIDSDGNLSFAESFDDIWRYDPNQSNPTDQWCQLTINIEGEKDEFLSRTAAIGFTVNEEYAIIGGGQNIFFDFPDVLSGFWEFRPNTDGCSATVKYIGSIADEMGDSQEFDEGVGFVLKEIPYVGLGNATTQLYKYEDSNWIPVTPLPDLKIFNGTGFSLNNRGYLFSGIRNDLEVNNARTVSKNLWVYIPE